MPTLGLAEDWVSSSRRLGLGGVAHSSSAVGRGSNLEVSVSTVPAMTLCSLSSARCPKDFVLSSPSSCYLSFRGT